MLLLNAMLIFDTREQGPRIPVNKFRRRPTKIAFFSASRNFIWIKIRSRIKIRFLYISTLQGIQNGSHSCTNAQILTKIIKITLCLPLDCMKTMLKDGSHKFWIDWWVWTPILWQKVLNLHAKWRQLIAIRVLVFELKAVFLFRRPYSHFGGVPMGPLGPSYGGPDYGESPSVWLLQRVTIYMIIVESHHLYGY